MPAADGAGLHDWLALSHARGVGPRTLKRLVERFGDPSRVLRADADALKAAGLAPSAVAAIRSPRLDLVEASLEWARSGPTRILVASDPEYPRALAELPDAPAVLYVRGDAAALRDPQLAIVGTRNPRHMASNLALMARTSRGATASSAR